MGGLDLLKDDRFRPIFKVVFEKSSAWYLYKNLIALGGNQDDVLLQKGKIMTKEVEVEMSHDQVEHSEAEGEKLKHPRHDDAHQIISKYMGWSAGAGAIPFPVADVVALAAVQTKMIKEILSLYDVTFSEVRIKSTLTILLGSLPPQMLAGAVAGSLTKLIPGVGQVLAPLSLVGLSAAAPAHLCGGRLPNNIVTVDLTPTSENAET